MSLLKLAEVHRPCQAPLQLIPGHRHSARIDGEKVQPDVPLSAILLDTPFKPLTEVCAAHFSDLANMPIKLSFSPSKGLQGPMDGRELL